MRVLFISSELIGSAICQKLLAEGNEVKLYIHRKDWKSCLTGIVPKVKNWRDELHWVGKEGLIVFDDVIFGKEQDELRIKGYNVVGGSARADRLELDRAYFQDLLTRSGIQTLPSYDFESPEEAIAFVRKKPGRYVVKQSTHQSSLNYIGKLDTGEDSISTLYEYRKRKISPIHLQQFVDGIEVGVARYFNGIDWVGPIEINHEHKRLHDSDIGPLTPEMGTILWYSETTNKLFETTLAKLKPILQEISFRGDIDINCIVNREGVWPLEATPRFGTPSSEIQVELHTSPWADFLLAIATGHDYPIRYHAGYGIGVSVAHPPFPHPPSLTQKCKKVFTRYPLLFASDLTPEEKEKIRFEEISFDDRGYHWSGQQGWLLHVTAHAPSISEARTEVYRTINKIVMPNLFYRSDIGQRVEQHDLPLLKEWGWL
jgi:phosphoribosylamine---glycine ligase